ncbi:MAG: response regulator, partial [Saccharofermentanaceae bacterium]
ELINDFKVEAAEQHQTIINGLVALEKGPPTAAFQQLVETTFREIHSMKGAARAVNQTEIGRLCQGMESVFHQVKSGDLALTSVHFDALYQATDLLAVMLAEIDKKEKSFGANTLAQMMKRLDALTSGEIPPKPMEFPALPRVQDQPKTEKQNQPVPKPVVAVPPAADTVRIATAKLGTLLHEAEEFISVKATLGYYIQEIQKQQNQRLSGIIREMKQFHHALSRMVDDLLLDIKTTLLYPFSTLLDIFPKIVRDLGKEYKKEINLTIQGGEIEIDRRILEEIKDPLIHIIRNCIDHGLETPEIRKEAGKAPSGILEMIVKKDTGRHVILTIRDDGTGIDRKKVLQSALKMGIVTSESAERMTDQEVFSLIFRSGISTSQFITDISGRGLGMAIVAEKISKLGGDIATSSIPGQGAAFTITLPVTISNFRGILVQISEQFFIIPTTSVERAIRIRKKGIRSVETSPMISLNDESIALVRLGDVLGIPPLKSKTTEDLPVPVLILSLAPKKIAFIVDYIHGEQEGMVKDMGPQLIHVRNISGITVLGSGQIIPILNIPELMDSATHAFSPGAEQQPAYTESLSDHQKYILVAEDSITLRILLKNILESSGYMVKTAVDGMEAFQFLKNEVFDLVVSDVEMPRMNGFDLTSRIRNDKTLSETPVILVTALDSPEDRQKGIESGADAYIIKGNFEQSNLLDTIHRLI